MRWVKNVGIYINKCTSHEFICHSLLFQSQHQQFSLLNLLVSTFVKRCLILLESKTRKIFVYMGHFYCSEKYQLALWNNVLIKDLSICRKSFYGQNECSSFHCFEHLLLHEICPSVTLRNL